MASSRPRSLRRVPRRTARRALIAVLASLTVAGSFAAPAAASTRTPAVPTGMKVAALTSSSFTVTAHAAEYATGYRLYLSVTKADLAVAKISKATRSATYKAPRVTASKLTYKTVPYYYRFVAVNGSKIRYATVIGSVHLRPAVPTGVRASSGSAGFHLSWSSGAATGFAIAQATDARTMQTGRRDYTIRGSLHQFTPDGLAKGRTYYFRIAALNGATKSSYSAQVHITAAVASTGVRVMTYNILGNAAGLTEHAAPWLQRRAGAAKLITQTHPDVVAIEEGADWVNGKPGVNNRQVDSLRSALGGAYSLADTEIVYPSQHGKPPYLRTASYILYNKSTYAAVGDSFEASPSCAGKRCWELGTGDGRYAVYQELQNRATGAKFLFVAVHTTPVAGAAGDTRRKRETEVLLGKVKDYLAVHPGEPVIYAGDFNSVVNRNHVFDGPGQVMAGANVADAFDAAQTLTNARYNSANQLLRTPPAFGQSIDHIYAPQGVGVRTWGLVMNLVDGKFVGVIPSDHNPLYADLYFP